VPAVELPVLSFDSAAEWRAWLAAAPPDSPGLWLKFARKGSEIASVTHPEALELAI
jgi:uncharacterized protein YdeI (YjbR/CyaY-like superfamily)